MMTGDTIAAISSAVGMAARMIVRISGAAAFPIAEGLSLGLPGGAGVAARVELRFSGLSFPATAYVFRTPRSYTGEDLVEFHIPGNPVLAKLLLDAILAAGARAAGPGEFTARAYFNGRLDLTEAEGVAATISAGSAEELSAARRLLSGELARRLRPVMESITRTLALVETGIDFSDEDVTFLSADEAARLITEADRLLERLVTESARFARISHEPHLVLVGRPNAGKSTLLNVLAGHDRAVTSPVAGTTRDLLSAEIPLRRGIVRLTDAAGLDDEETHSDPCSAEEEIHRRMRQHALRAVEAADLLVLVRDLTDGRPPLAVGRTPDVIVYTKSDLAEAFPTTRSDDEIRISAVTGQGIAVLCDRLDRLAFGGSTGHSTLALNARHLNQIEEARIALQRAGDRVREAAGPELLALELREALNALGNILGEVTPDDLLGKIFSAFCIGK